MPGQLTGDGSLFRIMLAANPIVDYRTSVAGALPAGQLARLHRALLDEGIIVSSTGLGALSTPMGEPEVDRFVASLTRALATLQQSG